MIHTQERNTVGAARLELRLYHDGCGGGILEGRSPRKAVLRD